ncbi:MAG: permease [Spirochaetales bacterium]|nr:permease [Spirochaetales bacterium]
MMDILHREFVYLWYYFDIQLRQIFWYWVIGIVIGSCVSVFLKDQIHRIAAYFGERCPGLVGIVIASALGIASPLCMYGTIPICAAFSRKGIKDDFLAAFMMSSILLNPQLIIYSTALGVGLLWVRILSSFVCGIAAGLLVRIFYCSASFPCLMRKSGSHTDCLVTPDNDSDHSRVDTISNCGFFNFSAFDDPHNHDTHPNIVIRLLLNILRNIKATGLWFLVGIVLSAVFQRYVPAESIAKMFGKEHEGFALLMAATIGVPLYVCGGGTIPLILQWLADGMSAGSVAAFMITGPATKITNLGALKIALGVKHFILYLLFVMTFAVLSGFVVNIIL